MPKFSANLSMLFTELPFLDRFEAAARADFKAVEFLFPYAFPVKEIRQRLDDNNLSLVLHNLPAGNWETGERGIACDPARTSEFRAGIVQAIEYAQGLGVGQLNCLAGKVPLVLYFDSEHDRQELIDACIGELSTAELDELVELWANPDCKREYTDLPEDLLVRRILGATPVEGA